MFGIVTNQMLKYLFSFQQIFNKYGYKYSNYQKTMDLFKC